MLKKKLKFMMFQVNLGEINKMLGLEKVDWSAFFTYLFMIILLGIYMFIMYFMTKNVGKK